MVRYLLIVFFFLSVANAGECWSADKALIELCSPVLSNSSDQALDYKEAYNRCYYALNQAYRVSKLDYDMQQLEHRGKVLAWQYTSSWIIFWVVFGLILIGIVLSYQQFRQGDRSVTSIKIGTGSLEIKSSVLGLLILIISLAFFYLYLVNIYPVKEVIPAQRAPVLEK